MCAQFNRTLFASDHLKKFTVTPYAFVEEPGALHLHGV